MTQVVVIPGARIALRSQGAVVLQGVTSQLVSAPARQADYEALALPLLDQLYAAALRMTQVPEAAEDLVQDALLRGWRFFDRFESGTNFRAWIFRILTNLYINQYRKAQSEPLKADLDKIDRDYDALVAQTITQRPLNPEDALLQHLEARVVREAVDGLPEVFRLPVILCDLEGFAYKEIADMLEVPIGTVMSRLYRGRKQLYTSLLGYAQVSGYVSTQEGTA